MLTQHSKIYIILHLNFYGVSYKLKNSSSIFFFVTLYKQITRFILSIPLQKYVCGCLCAMSGKIYGMQTLVNLFPGRPRQIRKHMKLRYQIYYYIFCRKEFAYFPSFISSPAILSRYSNFCHLFNKNYTGGIEINIFQLALMFTFQFYFEIRIEINHYFLPPAFHTSPVLRERALSLFSRVMLHSGNCITNCVIFIDIF